MNAGVPDRIAGFLHAETPEAWLEAATARLVELLNDHANCELKAASTALSLIYRYPERAGLSDRMSRLAREELRHFEQVRKIMNDHSVPYRKLTASRYAGAMRDCMRRQEPSKLLDSLLVGALIEARSCERFALLAPRLPERIGEFYRGLLASEARHFEDYLALARSLSGFAAAAVESRLQELLAREARLITSPDDQFRFHSGVPEVAAAASLG